MRRSRLRACTLLCALLLTTMSGGGAPAMAGDETRLKTRLAGDAIGGVIPSGAAEFRQRGADKRFTTQVEDVNLADQDLRVCVNDLEVGTISLVAGLGDLNLDTRNAQAVPGMSPGNTVKVRSGSTSCGDGTAILMGELATKP